MKKIKKNFFWVTSILNFLTPLAALAQSAEDRLTSVGAAAGFGENPTTLPLAIGGVIQAILALLGIVFMAYIIYAGWSWMTAHGEEEKVKKAKTIIRGCIIGLVIVLAAYIITATVIDRFTEATGYTDEASD